MFTKKNLNWNLVFDQQFLFSLQSHDLVLIINIQLSVNGTNKAILSSVDILWIGLYFF